MSFNTAIYNTLFVGDKKPKVQEGTKNGTEFYSAIF